MIAKYIRYTVKNYLFAVMALIFTVLFWLSAKRLPARAIVFPKALIFVLIPLFAWNLIASVIGFRKTLRSAEPDEKKWNCTLHLSRAKIVVTLATAAYILLMPRIGFIVTTALYLAGLAFFLGVRKPLSLIIFTVVYVAVVYGVFGLWLHVRFPSGILI